MPSTKLLKERIESIQDTMKITNAMYLISSSKLRKARKNYQAVSPYFERMQMTMTRVLPHLPEEPVHPFFHTRNPESPRRAYLVLTADKGMAGAYNQNLLKFLKSHCGDDPKARFYVVGQTGYRALLHGLDEDVQHIRAKNKERILHALVQKIEHRKNPASRFHFEEGLSYEEKFNLVSEWWNDFRFHLAMAVKSPTELNRLLGNSLSAETMYLLSKARKKGMPFFATPYYLSLLNCTGSGYDDEALRSYILYSPQLVETY